VAGQWTSPSASAASVRADDRFGDVRTDARLPRTREALLREERTLYGRVRERGRCAASSRCPSRQDSGCGVRSPIAQSGARFDDPVEPRPQRDQLSNQPCPAYVQMGRRELHTTQQHIRTFFGQGNDQLEARTLKVRGDHHGRLAALARRQQGLVPRRQAASRRGPRGGRRSPSRCGTRAPKYARNSRPTNRRCRQADPRKPSKRRPARPNAFNGG